MQESISADDKWAGLIQQALEHAEHFDWGLYTNTQLEMADHLKKEDSPKHELELLFWVLYLDINGPENRGGIDSDLLEAFPPFDPEMAVVAPVIAKRATSLIASLGMDANTARFAFIHGATRRRNKLMPISPEQAWDKLQTHIATPQEEKKS